VSVAKQVMWWISGVVLVTAGLLAGFPPSSSSKVFVWLGCLIALVIFIPVFVILNRERVRAAKKDGHTDARDDAN
jgi:type III secretory pathway component EscV